MADYSFLTDSDDEKAVENLLSQAIDHSVLEQVSKINCSSFSSDSPLPSHLESRFRKLKSFPSTTTPTAASRNLYQQSKSLKPQSINSPPIENPFPEKCPKPLSEMETKSKSRSSTSKMSDSSIDDDSIFSSSKCDPLNSKSASKSKSKHGSFRSNSSSSSIDDSIITSSKPYPSGKKLGFNSKSGKGSRSFGSVSKNSSTWSSDSDSSPRKTGCFWCSPKKSSGKKSRENRFPGIGLDRGKDDDLLSDMSSFSIKEQRKILKKAMIEEEKINREAEKIVKWAKQASARMNVSGLEDDELSDNEPYK